jgi:hypothetical protein
MDYLTKDGTRCRADHHDRAKTDCLPSLIGRAPAQAHPKNLVLPSIDRLLVHLLQGKKIKSCSPHYFNA